MTQPSVCQSSFPMTCPRLSLGQLLVAMLIVVATLAVIPHLWQSVEPFEPTADYRTPYALSEDYWMFRRLVDYSQQIDDAVVIVGDSVVWGEYVKPEDSLPAILNRRLESTRFINGGVNGLHPMAIDGLVRLHGSRLRNRRVIVHCNLLWLSSPERDLSSLEPQSFNHASLVAQFGGKPNPTRPLAPAFDAKLSERIAIATTRSLPYRILVDHVRRRSFGGQNIHQWSLSHPRTPFWNEVDFQMVEPDPELRHVPVDWTRQGIRPQSFEWITVDRSLQFQSLLSAVAALQSRGNRVLVIIGPFNRHLLLSENAGRFFSLRQSAVAAFAERRIPHIAPAALPSDQYGDASHPLAAGYLGLAEQIIGHREFQAFIAD